MTWSVYLGSICDSPGRTKVTGQFVKVDETLCKGCVFDYLTIQWDNINLNLHDLDLKFPSNHLVSLTSKIFFRGHYLEIQLPYSKLLLTILKMVK